MLRLRRLPLRIRERRHSQWLSLYELLPGGRTKERAMRGYAASDPDAAERLCEKVISIAKHNPSLDWDAVCQVHGAQAQQSPCWPAICDAVVAFQRGQGLNTNLVGPFRGGGYFRLLPPVRPGTLEDVRRFALHTSKSLKARLLDPSEPPIPIATHRQGFLQKREVVSLLRRAGFAAIAPQELKGMVNRKKLALVAADQARRRIPSTDTTQEWLDLLMEEDPLWGWVFAMIATYGLRPREVWHIDGLPDQHGLITVGVAARHIRVTKTYSRPE